MPTPHKPSPRWQPIGELTLIARAIDGQLEAAGGNQTAAFSRVKAGSA